MNDKSRFSREVHFWESPEIVEALERIAADNGRSMSAEIRGAIRSKIVGTDHRARLDDEQRDRLVEMARGALRARGIDPADDRDGEVDRIMALWQGQLDR